MCSYVCTQCMWNTFLHFFLSVCVCLSLSPFLGNRKIDLGVGKKNGMCDKPAATSSD